MRFLKTTAKTFPKEFKKITHRGETLARGVEDTVAKILKAVRLRGDQALFQYTRQFDHFTLNKNNLQVSTQEIKKAYTQVDPENLKALKLAAERIHDFHHRIRLKSWVFKKEGVTLGQRVTPLERVGIYVPGGKATYPSTVLMNAIPACVAGVDEIIMVTPFPRGEVNPYVLVAADLAGVNRIYKMGGAQAVAALAYGTQSIPRVDKIVGPGNIYVATAKRQVFGQVDIDMIAGPSEVVVVSDGKVNPDWVAADLLSQAEHDEKASSVLLTWNKSFLKRVDQSIQKLLKNLPRAAIAKRSLAAHGALILTKNSNEAADLVNAIAPEHLELAVQNPKSLLAKIRNAGAIFLGPKTTESFGDYLAGPNHVLPTSGTARFSSPLSTLDFLKFSSVIECGTEAIRKLGPAVVRLAELEGLTAHALAMKLRL
jgi:histidinol dehydrogenase